jgi:hypothetical protein
VRAITRACSPSTTPAASASRVAASVSSRAVASLTSPCATLRGVRVAFASQAPVEVAADAAAMSARSPAASTRSRSASSRACPRARSTNTPRVSSGLSDQAGTVASPSRRACNRAVKSTIGCAARVSAVLLVPTILPPSTPTNEHRFDICGRRRRLVPVRRAVAPLVGSSEIGIL